MKPRVFKVREHRYESPRIDLEQIQQDLTPHTKPSERSSFRSGESVSDVVDTNPHTSNLEFYGGSSSVAFLRHFETISNTYVPSAPAGPSTLTLHSTEVKSTSSTGTSFKEHDGEAHAGRFYFRVAQRFLDAYFSNIHFIQPILDEESFLRRCESLWFNNQEQHSSTFVALYYATLSLGCLVTTGEDWEKYGSPRFMLGRKLLDEALSIVNQLGPVTDLEMVQCYYMIVSAQTS